MFCLVYIFFFKQKTAYELRISDWSSDVCSSDLAGENKDRYGHQAGGDQKVDEPEALANCMWNAEIDPGSVRELERSEEHTSELQSLMRISYAVFCLKKKNKKQ